MTVALASLDDLEHVVTRLLDARPPRFALTVKETADSLGTSPDTIRRLIRAGHLPVVPHMGARQLVPVAALEQFVASGTSRADAGTPSADGAIGTSAPAQGEVLPLQAPARQGTGGHKSTARGGPSTPAA